MKLRIFLASILLTPLFYFSPQIATATPNHEMDSTSVIDKVEEGKVNSVEEPVQMEDSNQVEEDSSENPTNPINSDVEDSTNVEQKETTKVDPMEEQSKSLIDSNEEPPSAEKEKETINVQKKSISNDESKVKIQTKKVESKADDLDSNILQIGMHHKEAIQLKKDLETLGFVNWKNEPNDYFGPSTENAVRELQDYYGLEVTGKANKTTLAKMEEILSLPLQKGKRHNDAIQLKKDLEVLGYVKWKNAPNNFYGSSTEKAVKAFQKDHNLPVSGIAEPITKAKINELANAPLRVGMYRNDAIQVKKNLEKLGFVNWKNKPNDYFGPSSETALIAFQKQYKLNVSRVVDKATLEKMNEIFASPLQKGKRHPDAVELKKDLEVLGYIKWKKAPNNYYGSSTEKAVKAFQKDHVLPESGIVDPITKVKIKELANGPLRIGMYRNDVVELKENLEALGFVNWKNKPNNYYGPSTEKAVKALQKQFGLKQTGIADEGTLAKINDVLSSPLQKGKRHDDAIQLKRDLAKLGYVTWKNEPNNYYGLSTKKAVQKFQRVYGLPVSGIADDITLATLTEAANTPFQSGKRHHDSIQLKENLEKLGFVSWKNKPNEFYGSSTAKAVKKLQKYYGLTVSGVADKFTLAKIDEILSSPLQNGKKYKDAIQLKKDLEILGYVNWKNKPNNFYGSSTKKAVEKFQKANGLPVSGIADPITLQKIRKAADKAVKASSYNIKIFLDAGHGGKDSGAVGHGLKEKDVVLDIALKTADVLASNYLGVDIKLSRTTDKFIELVDRAKMANDWGADYFVSFHNNAFNGNAKGFETYIYNGSTSKETIDRQKDIHNYLAKRIDVNDRGMKRENFNVLRNSKMPSILIEYMFIDNKRENNLLKSLSYRDYLGRITAEAIANSFGLKKK